MSRIRRTPSQLPSPPIPFPLYPLPLKLTWSGFSMVPLIRGSQSLKVEFMTRAQTAMVAAITSTATKPMYSELQQTNDTYQQFDLGGISKFSHKDN